MLKLFSNKLLLMRKNKRLEQENKMLRDSLMKQPFIIGRACYLVRDDGVYDVYTRIGRTRTPCG